MILRLEHSSPFRRLDADQFRKAVGAVSLGALILLFVTWGRVRVLANSYQIMELKAERDGLLAERRRMERNLEDVQSLSYAETVARQRLGMVDINPNQVIALRRKSGTEELIEDVTALFSSKKDVQTAARAGAKPKVAPKRKRAR